jgi:hypothetical protein
VIDPTEIPETREPLVLRHARKLRLLPLVLLLIAAMFATLLGVRHEMTQPDTTSRAAGIRLLDLSSRACTGTKPPPDRTEPWQGKHRRRSEAAFAEHMKSEKPAYVRGRNGWVFYNDWQAANFSQALGRTVLSDAEADHWARWIKRQQRIARRGGSGFAVVIAPAKWSVYDNELPAWTKDLRGTVSSDFLAARHPELPLIDVRPALRDGRKRAPTYAPLNSHWTSYGGYVAWQAMTRCLQTAGSAWKNLTSPELIGVGREPDRSEFVDQGLASTGDNWTVPEYSEPHPATALVSLNGNAPIAATPDNTVDMTVLPARTTTPDAPVDSTLLVMRDSTGSALSPLWSATFRRTVQVAHGFGTGRPEVPLAELTGKYRPALTLLVLTERYLSYGPPHPAS